jgi:TolA-binding protein
VLTRYFQHKVAASAQYRVARCLDALGRKADATGSYQAVVSGYPLEPEALPAAYLAGVGLLERGAPRAAAPYFQIVLDRYLRGTTDSTTAFARPEQRVLVEAALCMLEWSWHAAGDMGQVAGAPHLLLQKMPASRSPWRAWALLIDADATAALGRYADAQTTLERLAAEFPDHAVSASATELLAWTYARQDRDSLAIATEERMLARWGATADQAIVSTALLDIGHARFNQKRYKEAAATYEDFLRRWPQHRERASALYQAGLCYQRLDRAGDAVDRWETLVKDSASSALAERAWARAGDVYFQAERFDDARRCYRGLLENFAGSPAAGLASLRLAQCEYNAGHDAAALEAFAITTERYPATAYAKEAQRGTELALYRLAATANGDQVLARLVEQYPSSAFAADALLQIGKRHYQAKRWREAAEDFRQVVSRFPAYSSADQAQFLMADALAQADAGEEARNAYEQFLAYFPHSELRATVSFRLGVLRFASKEYMQAAVEFTRALEDSAPAEVSGPARYNLALCERQLGSWTMRARTWSAIAPSSHRGAGGRGRVPTGRPRRSGRPAERGSRGLRPGAVAEPRRRVRRGSLVPPRSRPRAAQGRAGRDPGLHRGPELSGRGSAASAVRAGAAGCAARVAPRVHARAPGLPGDHPQLEGSGADRGRTGSRFAAVWFGTSAVTSSTHTNP